MTILLLVAGMPFLSFPHPPSLIQLFDEQLSARHHNVTYLDQKVTQLLRLVTNVIAVSGIVILYTTPK